MTRLAQLLELAEASPNDPLAHYAVGLECINLKRWDDALAAFDKALAIDARYTAAYYHKARAAIRGNQREVARAALNAGIECARASADLKTEREMRELLETIG